MQCSRAPLGTCGIGTCPPTEPPPLRKLRLASTVLSLSPSRSRQKVKAYEQSSSSSSSGGSVSHSFPASSRGPTNRAGETSHPHSVQTLGWWIFSTLFKLLFWKTIFLYPWSKDKRLSICHREPRGQSGICLKAFWGTSCLYFSTNGREGAAAGGLASWWFSQLALGKSLQPDPAVVGALTSGRIQTFSPDLKAGGGPASFDPAFSL